MRQVFSYRQSIRQHESLTKQIYREMSIPTLPPVKASTQELLLFIRSVLGVGRVKIEKKYNTRISCDYFSRQHIFNFDIGKIILIYNMFDICDICIVEFGNLQESAKCYEICDARLRNAGIHLWFDNDTLVHFYIGRTGKRSFRFCLEPLRSQELQ